MITKRPDSEEGIGEVSGSRRACCCRGLVQLIGEELMAKEMNIESHKGESKGSERGHSRKRKKEDAKVNGIIQQLADVEYDKELAEIRE